MKNICTILVIACVGSVFSQEQARIKLDQNLTSMTALQDLLNADFMAVSDVSQVVPGATFVFANTMVFNAFGDEAAQAQAQTIETEFGTTFNESTWKFQVIDSQNGSQTLTVKTMAGEQQTANYSCSGAVFSSGNLIAGFDLQCYLFKSKTNPKNFILLFTVTNGITLAADFTQQ